MTDSLSKSLTNYEKIDSILYQVPYADFATISDLQNYLENADENLSSKATDLNRRVEILQQELLRTTSVYEINNKRRFKQEELLRIQRQKLLKELELHKARLNVQVHPITMTLNEKRVEIERLRKTKDIISHFSLMQTGSKQQIAALMCLDDKNLKNSATKIYVFKCLLDEINDPCYETAKQIVKKKLTELRSKIINTFKEGFLKKDIAIVNNVLPYCEEYDWLDDICEMYLNWAFREVSVMFGITKEENGETEIKNFFFLLERGFNNIFNAVDTDSNTKNVSQVTQMLPKHVDLVSRKAVSFVFSKILKESIDKILQIAGLRSSDSYLRYLQCFYSECKNLMDNSAKIISDQRILQLMVSHFQSIFDSFLDSYLPREISNLSSIYEECISMILETLKETAMVQEAAQAEKALHKFSFKKLMDYRIESKKTITPQKMKNNLQNISKVFMEYDLERIFEVTKQALKRNEKISKMNNVDKNRNEILNIFIEQLGELIDNIIFSIGDLVPSLEDKAAVLDSEIFQIIPQINIMLQRMVFIYEENKKQARYELADSVKLELKKESLLLTCEKHLSKVIGDALACILTSSKALLAANPNQYYIKANKNDIGEQVSAKVITFLEKYIKQIGKINVAAYRSMLLATVGMQFVTMLRQHYSSILYSKDGLGQVYHDISNFKRIILLSESAEVQSRYQALRSLIDLYVIKNDEKTIEDHIKEKDNNLSTQKEDIVRMYVSNKLRCQKSK